MTLMSAPTGRSVVKIFGTSDSLLRCPFYKEVEGVMEFVGSLEVREGVVTHESCRGEGPSVDPDGGRGSGEGGLRVDEEGLPVYAIGPSPHTK